MKWLYNLALYFAAVLSSPWWLYRLATSARYRSGLGERLGRVPARLRAGEKLRCIWLHAVSVGEVLACGQLLAELRQAYPEHAIVISTTTAVGQRLARERHGEENVFYFPLDFGWAIRPYLRALQPQLVIMAETEFWPNFLRLARMHGAQIAVVNGRISDRSLPGYRRWRWFLRHVLANISLFLAQSEEDRRRLVEIGAPAARVYVSGNLKFDVRAPETAPIVAQLRKAIPPESPVIVCGSTVDEEEFLLWGALQGVLKEFPGALMILAPRRPERFDKVAALAAGVGAGMPERSRELAGMPRMNFWRRSDLPAGEQLYGGVLLLDSIGELASVYSLATLVFVGGSLVPRGGHNILEPAHFGKPILVGPHTENFRDVTSIFLAAGALRVVRGFRDGRQKGDLGEAMRELLRNPAEREVLGRRAAEVMHAHAGATARTVAALSQLMLPQPLFAELAAVERVW